MSTQGRRKRNGLWNLTVPNLSNGLTIHCLSEKRCEPLLEAFVVAAETPNQRRGFWALLVTQPFWCILKLIHMASGAKDTSKSDSSDSVPEPEV